MPLKIFLPISTKKKKEGLKNREFEIPLNVSEGLVESPVAAGAFFPSIFLLSGIAVVLHSFFAAGMVLNFLLLSTLYNPEKRS